MDQGVLECSVLTQTWLVKTFFICFNLLLFSLAGIPTPHQSIHLHPYHSCHTAVTQLLYSGHCSSPLLSFILLPCQLGILHSDHIRFNSMHYVTAHSLGGRREALTPRSCLLLITTGPAWQSEASRTGLGIQSSVRAMHKFNRSQRKQGIRHSGRGPLCRPAARGRCVLPRPDSLRALYRSLRASGVRVRLRSSPPATWIIQSTKYRLHAFICPAEIWNLFVWHFELVVARNSSRMCHGGKEREDNWAFKNAF